MKNQKVQSGIIFLSLISLLMVLMITFTEKTQNTVTNFSLATPEAQVIPLRQFVLYRVQSDYAPFNAAIFAQGQMSEAAKLPTGSEIVLYVDANRINGASGLQSGARCTDAQKNTFYNQDTITMDKRFCPDINDAILDKTAYYDATPTEAVFLHKANGERCYVYKGSASEYLINPRNYFYQNYLSRRIGEKLDLHNLNHVFLDDLRPSWASITSACGGAPKEYSLPVEYNAALRDLAEFVYLNVASKVYGNLAGAGAHWDEFTFLDGAMCESCFTNWGSEASTFRVLSDLQYIRRWDKRLYAVPMITQNEKFYFALSLLVAKDGDYYHFGDNDVYNALPEYTMKLGKPIGSYICDGNICSRTFEHGMVTVDLAARTGSISQVVPTETPIPTAETFDVDIAYRGVDANNKEKLLNVRYTSSASSGTAGYLPPNSTWEILEVRLVGQDYWGRIADNKWIPLYYRGVYYVTRWTKP